MEKQNNKKRDITFYSDKNGMVISVHSKAAQAFAEKLERDESIVGYKTNVVLENWQAKISLAGIRGEYLDNEWTSDFLVSNSDGSAAVRELMPKDKALSLSMAQKLELSRRYWKIAYVSDWCVVLV